MTISEWEMLIVAALLFPIAVALGLIAVYLGRIEYHLRRQEIRLIGMNAPRKTAS